MKCTKINSEEIDIIFASRYERDCSSEDDTFITFIGNFIFTKIGNIFFNLKITDILLYFYGEHTQSQKSKP